MFDRQAVIEDTLKREAPALDPSVAEVLARRIEADLKEAIRKENDLRIERERVGLDDGFRPSGW